MTRSNSPLIDITLEGYQPQVKQNQTPTSFKRSHQASTSGDGGLYGMVPLSIVLYYVGLIIRSRAFAEQSISGSDPWNPKCVSGL